MKTPTAERRAAERRPVEGEVRLRQTGVIAPPFGGTLVDLSASGFRARHACLALKSGDRVDFEFAGMSGCARAVWTRIVDGRAETGFSILESGG